MNVDDGRYYRLRNAVKGLDDAEHASYLLPNRNNPNWTVHETDHVARHKAILQATADVVSAAKALIDLPPRQQRPIGGPKMGAA